MQKFKSLFLIAFLSVLAISGLAACSTLTTQKQTTQTPKVIFLAGATGVIGEPLSKALVARGYTVYGTTRSQSSAVHLQSLGVVPVVLDVFDAKAVEQAVLSARPDVIINQVSSLPKGLAEDKMPEGLKQDAKARLASSKNLIAVAPNAGVTKFINHSFMYYAPSDTPLNENSPWLDEADETYGESIRAVREVERMTLAGDFTPVVLRYGWLYGGKSGFDTAVDGYPSVPVAMAVDATVRAVEADVKGVYNIAEESPLIDVSKFKKAVPAWQSH